MTFDRFLRTRKCDACLLGHDRGHGRQLRMPVYIVPQDPDHAWATCSLTQQPDSRFLARFTNIPDFVQQEWASSNDLQKKSLISYGRPHAGRTITVPALICWWAYGRPRDGDDIATHFVCDQSRCLNPRHLGWASIADNSMHAGHHQRTLRKRRPRSGKWRVPRHSRPPARRQEYASRAS